MKIFLILFVFVFTSCNGNQKPKSLDDNIIHKKNPIEKEKVMDSIKLEKHKIIKVDSIGDVFLVYTKKCDVYYKILSDNVRNNKCARILIGEYYDLKLKSVFPEKEKFSYKVKDIGILYNEQDIATERDSINDLHFAENLKGLCFIKNDK